MDEADLPIVADRAAARSAGVSDAAVTRRLRSGRWTPLRRGAFAPRDDLDPDTLWRAQVAAARAVTPRRLVLSHAHAARAHALPVPLGGWGALTFTAATGSRRYDAVTVLVAALPERDVELKGQVPVTRVARTVVDCARTLPGRDALALADAALHRGMVTHAELEAVLAQQHRWPGARRARYVVVLADGRRESPLESWSAWAFEEHGVPQPRWQVEVCTEAGAFVGRVDAVWPAQGVAGEADGRAKYRLAAQERGGADAGTLGAVLDDERLREMALRRTGLVVVRWDARDVLDPARAAVLARHLRAELARGGSFRGRLYLP